MTTLHPAAALWDALVDALAEELARRENNRMLDHGLLDSVAIGKRVGRSSKTIKRWMKAGLLPYRKVQGRWYATTEDFEKFLKRRSLRAA